MHSVSKHDVVAWIGQERYDSAGRERRQFGPPQDNARMRGEAGNAPSDHYFHLDVFDRVMSLTMPSESKMGLLIEIYRDVPEYGLLLTINMDWRDFDDVAHSRFWRFVVEELSKEESIIVGAIEYSRGVDIFADVRTAEEAWRIIVLSNLRNPTLVRRALANAGYIPIAWKEALYEELIGDEQWHQVILRNLFESRKHYSSAVDNARGNTILKRLHVSSDLSELTALEGQFGLPGGK